MEIYQDPKGVLAQKIGSWNKEHNIPKPAVLIFEEGGKLAWSYLGKNKVDRPAIATILKKIPAKKSNLKR